MLFFLVRVSSRARESQSRARLEKLPPMHGLGLQPTKGVHRQICDMKAIASIVLCLGLVAPAWCQSTTQQGTPSTGTKPKNVKKQKNEPGPGRQVSNGAGNIAGGAGKGAGDAAKGVGKGAANLATLHPIDAATSVGKGAGSAGKDVTVGAAKGSGKVVKGIGRGIKHLF
jgi:hypothetical protein